PGRRGRSGADAQSAGRVGYNPAVRRRHLLIIATAALAVTAAAAPPETERRPFTYTVGGHTIEDPHHWLEGNDAPERARSPDPALDRAVAEWTDAQNRYTRSVLDTLPGRDVL